MCIKKSTVGSIRNSKYLTIAIVWATLLLDFLLFSSIVPIIPKIINDQGVVGMDKSVNQSDSTVQGSAADQSIKARIEKFNKDNHLVGIFLAAKQAVQILVNLVAGPVTDRIGYDFPLLGGYVIIIISSTIFAVGNSYGVLLGARALQGVGSAFVSTCCMSLVAIRFKDDEERGKVFGFALCGLSVGLLVGPSFGSVLYDFGQKPAPFATLAALAFLMIIIQLIIRAPRITRSECSSSARTKAMGKVITDPYILCCSFVIILGNMGIGMLEGTLPLHMLTTMSPAEWMLGVVFLPMDGGYVVGVAIYNYVIKCSGMWYATLLPRFIAAGCLCAYPFCTSFLELIAPAPFLGFSTCLMNATMYRLLATLVDIRVETSVYGTVYALANSCFAVAYGLGPLLGGLLVPAVGFGGCMFVAAGVALSALFPITALYKFLKTNSKLEKAAEDQPLLKSTKDENGKFNGRVHTDSGSYDP